MTSPLQRCPDRQASHGENGLHRGGNFPTPKLRTPSIRRDTLTSPAREMAPGGPACQRRSARLGPEPTVSDRTGPGCTGFRTSRRDIDWGRGVRREASWCGERARCRRRRGDSVGTGGYADAARQYASGGELEGAWRAARRRRAARAESSATGREAERGWLCGKSVRAEGAPTDSAPRGESRRPPRGATRSADACHQFFPTADVTAGSIDIDRWPRTASGRSAESTRFLERSASLSLVVVASSESALFLLSSMGVLGFDHCASQIS